MKLHLRPRRVAAAVAGLAVALSVSASAEESAVLSGHVAPQVRAATKLGRIPSDEKIELSLVVRLDQDSLERAIADLYGPKAPVRKHFLTPAEFAAKFGLASKRQALKDFAAAAGLTARADDEPNSQVVKVSGPAALVEKAFGVEINRYRGADGRTFRGHETDPIVPASLVPHLKAVVGLSTALILRPHLAFSPLRRRSSAAPRQAPAAARNLTGAGPSGGLAPSDIKTIYSLSGSLTGSGQTVALYELDGYDPNDVALYKSQFGLANTPVTFISVDSLPSMNNCGPSQTDPCDPTTANGGQADEGGMPDGGMEEVALDIDLVLALAPGVTNLLVYEALNDGGPGALDMYAKIANDGLASVISTSWGEAQAAFGGGSISFSAMTAEFGVYQQMTVQGQSIFAAAGDNGAYDNSGITTLAVDDPASQPYVTGVGGTSLSGTDASPSETVWNDGCIDRNKFPISCSAPGASAYEAGGGGIANFVSGSSVAWHIPPYQVGVTGTASTSFRNVPDVALNADPDAAPYSICVGGTCNDTVNFTTLVGGTSAAAPLWAAFTALVNQERATYGGGALGFANPPLYQIGGNNTSYAKDFNDITSASNGSPSGPYLAAAGYDNASGWGSFKANALINDLSVPSDFGSSVTVSAVTLSSTSVQWSWSALAGASAYNVYYATNASQSIAAGVQSPFLQTGLTGNATFGILLRAEFGSHEGTGGASLSTTTLASPPAATPAVTQFVSSATFSFSACPSIPSPLSCSGYEVQAALNAGFTSSVVSSVSFNAAPVPLTFLTLTANTTYFMRLAYLNRNGAPAFGPSATFTTLSGAFAPSSPAFPSVSTGSIVFGWSQGSNQAGLTYLASASTSPVFAGTVLSSSSTALSADFSPLIADTSYYFQVQAQGGPFLTAGPQATNPVPPGAPANAFTALGPTTATVAWNNNGDQPDTQYKADIAPVSNFTSGVLSAVVRSTSAAFSGLSANTPYFARVAAVSRAGVVGAEIPLGSATTAVSSPTLSTAPFSALGAGGFTFSFNQTNAPGTLYAVLVSTDPGFSVFSASAATTAASASFAGLQSNQFYSAEVAALNSAGSPTSYVSASTATLVAAPLPGAAPLTPGAAAMALSWSAGTLSPGTSYFAQVSSSPVFAFIAASTATAGTSAAFAGLQPNTTYFLEVKAFSRSADPDGPFLSLAGATLPNPPGSGAFTAVFYTSATVAWQALPPAPSSAAAEGYLVQFSTAPDFSAVAAAASALPGASTASVTGLGFGTTYYARVGAVGWQGAADFLNLGSTLTIEPPLSSGTVSGSGLALTVVSPFPQVTLFSVFVPPAAFPAGTGVSAVANVGPFPAATTNEASSITPLGSVGFNLSAGGLQPAAPVRVMMSYDPAQIPLGQSERTLQLWRFDAGSNQWTVVPSQDDPTGHVLTAFTPHFSLFAPFFTAAGTDVSSVQVFPQPWEIGDSSSQYWASALTFTGLPAGGSVKIMTMLGELVWSGTAGGGGVLTWDGNNRFGRSAASGTYYALFQANGQNKTRRVVVIR